MKRLLCVVLMVAAGWAQADQLEDANKLLAAKAYGQALPIFQKLAIAGNAEAQFRLGEMYWFGDGTAMDLAKATEWFQKAAAAGNADARESLEILKRRQVRGNEITYWTKSYAGEDLTSGKFDCKAPVIPALSKTNAEITATQGAVVAWEACYNGFVANINDSMPPGKRIPADVLDMMTPSEIDLARQHLDQVYGKVAGKAQADATAILAQRDAWSKATQQYVAAENSRIEAQKTVMLMEERRLRDSLTQQQNAPVGPKPNGH